MATKLFVGNLNYSTSEQTLRDIFGTVGIVKSVEISNARGPRGFGFVEMETPEQAHRAITEIHKTLIDDREIRVEYPQPQKPRGQYERRPSFGGRRPFRGPRGAPFQRRPRPPPAIPPTPSPTRVYVNNIPWTTDDNALQAHFQQFNPKSANVVRRQNGSSFGYGFVEFETQEQQQAAIAALNNSNLGGRQISCKQANLPIPRSTPAEGGAPAPPPFRPRGPRGPGRFRRGPGRRFPPRRPVGPPQPDSPTRIFVANLPFSVTDEELLQMFQNLPATAAHVATLPNNKSRGFGFVDFATHEAQQQAIETFNGQSYGDRKVTVRVARIPRSELETPAPQQA